MPGKIGDTFSNGCYSIVMSVFEGVYELYIYIHIYIYLYIHNIHIYIYTVYNMYITIGYFTVQNKSLFFCHSGTFLNPGIA